VVAAMRYGAPSLASVLATLQADGHAPIVVLPLYPQYSGTTTGSIADVIARASTPGVRMLHDYHLEPAWIAAVADSVRDHWRRHGRGEHLLLSLHGIPQRLVDAGDPYQDQCVASARAIAAALQLRPEQWTLSYQSRFGRERWLQPATVDVIDALAAGGTRTLDVVCPGFAADCLETLEEIAIMLAARFARAGGRLHCIPCLNAAPAHADALAALAQRELA
jgi:protoporphyrin/coproporphyrin ferrochelatase